MMELVIDLGNTNQKIALFDAGKLLWIYTSKHIGLSYVRNIVQQNAGIGSCILSSVVKIPAGLQSFLEKKFRFILLDESTPLPILNHYRSPETLGRDRLAAAVAGSKRFPGKAVLIINAGTAITYDVVTAKGEYLGGSISPGMNLRFRALHTFTKQLPLLTYSEINFITGNDTNESVLSGVINGMSSEMKGMIACYRKEYPGIKVILSGGDLNYFVNRLKISIFANPNIVIYGLQQILSFNEKNPL
jgi:type III pantothenate kinase